MAKVVASADVKKQGKNRKRRNFGNALMCTPLVLWVVALIIAPLLYLLFISLMTKGPMGTVKYVFSLESYKMIANPVYLTVLKKSVWIAFMSTVLCIALGYPLAYFIANRKTSKVATIFNTMLMLPFWTCVLVIIYSFVILLNSSGIINSALMALGIIKKPLEMLYTDGAVTIGMIYMLLPFSVMPMYSSLEKMDKTLLEASKDLGGSPVKTFFKVTLPLTAPGISAAVILTFIPCIGYYMITDSLGGGTSMMLGNVIYNQFTSARNWPFGASLSIILAAVILLMVTIYSKMGGDLDNLA